MKTGQAIGDSPFRSKDSPIGIMIVAGEASGDKHGAALARALVEAHPQINFDFFGSGGSEMRAAGVDTLVDARDVAIIGIPEIARALRRLFAAYRRLIDAARSRRPRAVVLIDWPDFNLRLARKLHPEGFTIIYYVSPQVWAWRRYRVRAIRRDVDRMLVILPFEEEFYRKAGVEVTYVGHPLADSVQVSCTRDEFARRHGLDPARPIIALLPGSRKKEIHYHLPPMLDAASRLSNASFNCRGAGSGELRRGGPQFVMPLASTVERVEVEAILNGASYGAGVRPVVVERGTYDALGNSDIAVVASGTATVEAALLGTPMVIVYRASEMNWRLIRPLIKLDTFGMVNLIAGHRVVPELIQHDVTGERIAGEVTAMLADPERTACVRQELASVRELLSGGGAGAARAAQEVMSAIGLRSEL